MQFNEERIVFSTNGARIIVKKKPSIYIWYHIQKWNIDLNIKSKCRKLLEKYIGDYVCDLGLGNIAYILHQKHGP